MVPSPWQATSWVIVMVEPERWQVSADAAEVYESCFVPAIFGAWAGPVADAAGIRAGARSSMLAVGPACSPARPIGGSGTKVRLLVLILMRGCWRSRRELGRTSNGDEAMRRHFPSRIRVSTSWSASSRSCTFRTGWPPPRDVAHARARGRLAVAAWAPIDHARGYQILVEIAVRQCGREAADVLAAPFVLGDKAELAVLSTAASRGPRFVSMRVRSGFHLYRSSSASRSKARPWLGWLATM